MIRKLQLTVIIAGVVALSACGGGPVDFLDSTHQETHEDEVINAEEQPQAPQAASPANGDETILPTAPSTPAPSYDEPAALPDNPAPAADPIAAYSLHLKAEKKFDTRLGLVKLTWTATGPIEELYLWSEGFNRLPGDKNADDPCGPIANASMGGTRHLLVNSIDGSNLGYDLNDGSPAHTALIPYLDSAQLCDTTVCTGFSEASEAPACRIDLDPSQSVTLYTRALTASAAYFLCARTFNGTNCYDADEAIKASSVSLTARSITQVQDKIRFQMEYLNAIRKAKAPTGCTEIDGTYFDGQNDGHGLLTVECPIALVRAGNRSSFAARGFANGEIRFSAYGIGNGNVTQRDYDIDQGHPVLSVKHIGEVHCDDGQFLTADCKGRVNLLVEAYRKLTVSELKDGQKASVFEGDTSMGPIKIYSNQGEVSYASSEQKSPTKVQFNGVPRSHEYYQWQAGVELNGKTYKSAFWNEPRFPAQFELTGAVQALHPSDWDSCDHENVNDGEAECGVCVETSGYYEASVGWHGRNLKRITADCTSSSAGIVASGLSIEIPDGYEAQGNLLGSPTIAFQVPVSGSGWADQLTCTLTGEGYDGTKIVRTQPWTPNCAYTNAVQGGGYDPNLEGAFIENGSGWFNSLDLWINVSSQWDGKN